VSDLAADLGVGLGVNEVGDSKCSRMAAALTGSFASRLVNVSSDRTTPQPKVSSARLRSKTAQAGPPTASTAAEAMPAASATSVSGDVTVMQLP